MSEPTALPLDESKLPFKIPKDTKPREKIMKLGQMTVSYTHLTLPTNREV